MKKLATTRRRMLKQFAIAAGLAKAPALSGMEEQNSPNPGLRGGFKLGAVDWELTKPGDPGALAVAARLGFRETRDATHYFIGDALTHN